MPFTIVTITYLTPIYFCAPFIFADNSIFTSVFNILFILAPHPPRPKPGPSTPKPTPTLGKKTTPNWIDGFCKGKKMRNYPDPTRCDGFIACVGHRAVRMDCPAGLWYKFSTDQCDYPQNVDCKGICISYFDLKKCPLQ